MLFLNLNFKENDRLLPFILLDVDECAVNPNPCEANSVPGAVERCMDIVGGYVCSCKPGFFPALDYRGCVGKKNETQ